jgi:hypothetical protein
VARWPLRRPSDDQTKIIRTVTPTTYPARRASATELERLSTKARDLGFGSAGSAQLWADANRAVMHTGYAVSKDLMAGEPDASAAEGTAWTISTGHEVLLTVWWIRLKRTRVTGRDTFSALITMQPEDYVALQSGRIGAEQLAEAHHVAGQFLRDAGL